VTDPASLRSPAMVRFFGRVMARAMRRSFDAVRLAQPGWPRLADRRIDQIDRDVLSRLLLDIHARAPGTSDKIAQALSRVFRFALGRGYIEANPLEAARAALPRDFGSRARKAHPMVPVTDLPDFYAALVAASQGRGELCALALRFVTLTAARSGEVRLASWAEIDGALWRIPAERTKTGQPHIVPLTEEAVAVLEHARELTGGEGLIFPGSRGGQPLSDMTLSKRMNALGFKDADGRDAVPHGLRAGSYGGRPGAGERALGHAGRGDVQKAYDRATMVEKRRRLMAQGAEYLTGAGKGQVVRLAEYRA
jgi:integrase